MYEQALESVRSGVESDFDTVCVQFTIADCFFCFGEDDLVEVVLHQVT
jgi:hypothetical protein